MVMAYGDAEALSPIVAGNDCDDFDSDLSPESIWYYDGDGDTYGDGAITATQCEQPSEHVTDSTDCDDASSYTYPGAVETESSTLCMIDSDDDGYGDWDISDAIGSWDE
jgi:hypothetical protein